MQLHTGAGRFGCDIGRLHRQPLRPGDIDVDILTPPGGEDRIVEGLIARRGTHPVLGQVFGHQGRQDADHHDVRTMLGGLALGRVQAGPHLVFQLQGGATGKRTRWDVEFDVVSAQFGLIGRIGDGFEHLGVAQRRLIRAVDQIALDLHTRQRPVELETRLRQHGFEDIQAQLHLAPVLTAFGSAEVGLRDVVTHGPSLRGGYRRVATVICGLIRPVRTSTVTPACAARARMADGL